ncbi:MAG: AmmeMemoRadiSam system protein B [Chloroflexi bacterium]|nr:AmmeMemoRadiSam system protein B [Chloroflexota bacterium]
MSNETHDPRTVRTSAIAGTWYPGSKRELAKAVDEFLAQAEFYATDDELIALIAPHAGYRYSGPTSGHAYRQLTGRTFETVVLLGPSHSENWGPFAISAKQYYATPLGEIELAHDFIDRLADRIAIARVERDREHSLEIQLPYLQRTLGDFKLVPIMVTLPFYLLGAGVLEACQELSATLADLGRGRRVLFVASSDLSHIPDYEAVNQFDAQTAEMVAAFDIPRLAQAMSQDGECRACGDAPIVIALLAAQQLGANRARVLHRTNSGDVTGVRTRGQYTVGYLAAAVYKTTVSSKQ